MKARILQTAIRSTRVHRVGFVAAALVFTSILPAMVSTSNAATKMSTKVDQIDVGIALTPPKMVFLAPYVAAARGYFAAQHLDVHFIGMPDGLETELGTVSGSITFGLSSATDAISSAAAGTPLHAIWSYAPRLDTQCISTNDVKTAKDLVGQYVGSTGTGGFSYTQVYACLKADGVNVSDVKLVNMPRSQFVPNLVNGRIKAAVFHADDAYVVQHSGAKVHVLQNEYLTAPQWWYGGVAVLDSYAKSHKAVVERFLTAMVQADRWMTNVKNRAAVIRIGHKVTGEDTAAVAYAYDFLQKSHGWTLNDGMDPAAVAYTAQQMMNFKEIDKVPSYSTIVDNTYINDVLDKLGRVAE